MVQQQFGDASVDEQKALADKTKNENTTRSTKTWNDIYRMWARERGIDVNMEKIFPDELNTVLKKFFAEVRKQNGQEYEPDCLRVMQGSIHRYLIEKSYPGDIMNDDCFKECRNVLEEKSIKLRAVGMGKRPNARNSLSRQEEESLWEIGIVSLRLFHLNSNNVSHSFSDNHHDLLK